MIPRPGLALILLEQGWRGLVPILPPDAAPAPRLQGDGLEKFLKSRGKAPGHYLGDDRWQLLGGWDHYSDDERTVERWGAWPDVGIGLRGCRDDNNVVFIDSDILDEEAAGEARRIVRALIGLDAPVRIGRAPKEAFPVRTSGPGPKLSTPTVEIGGLKCAVELIGAGGQAVVSGTHPSTLRPYHWPQGGLDEITPADLPYVPRCDLAELFDRLGRMLLTRGARIGRARAGQRQEEGPGEARPVEELRARKPLLALDAALALRNGDWSYDDWVAWAYALRGAFGDAGEALWQAFAAQSAKNVPAASASVWRDVTKAEKRGELRSGAAAIMKAATGEGWKPPADLPTEVPDLPGADPAAMAALRSYVAAAAEREARERAQVDAIFAAMDRPAAGPEDIPPPRQPYWPADELDPAEAAARLAEALGGAVDAALGRGKAAGPAPQVGIQGAAGLGKTTLAIGEVAKHSILPGGGNLDFNTVKVPETNVFAPESRLLAEHARIAKDHGLPTQVIRGRNAKLDRGRPCRKHREAAAVTRAGLPVMPVLCRTGNPSAPAATCEFYDKCTFLNQFRFTSPAVRMMPHNYLSLVDHFPTMPPSFGTPAPKLVVIDESFAQQMTRHETFPLDRLTAPRTGMKIEHEAEIHPVAAKVRDLLERGEDPREAGDAETFRRLADLEMSAALPGDLNPALKWQVQKERAAALRGTYAFRFAAFWRVLAEEVGKPRPVQRIVLHRDVRSGDGPPRDIVMVHARRELALPDVPVVLLDASLDERIAGKFFPRLEVTRIGARRNGEFIQVSDTACSRRKLLGSASAPERDKLTAANRLRDVQHLIEVEAARVRVRVGPDARVLVATFLEVERRLLADGPIPNVDVVHFGGLRGLDAYKQHETIILVGRQQPPLRGHYDDKGHFHPGAEDIALALFGDEDKAVDTEPPGARMAEERRGYRMRDGTLPLGSVEVHRDPRVQAVIEQIREHEMVQAIDRLRLVHRERPARVVVVSNVVLPITVDKLVNWNSLMPDRLTVAAVRLDGVLPLAPAWLAARFSDLWPSLKAAEHEIARAGQNPQTPIDISIWEFGGFRTALFRRVGGGPRPSRALIRADHPEPEAALAELVGPLALFRWEGEAEPEAEAPPPPPPPDPQPDPVSVPPRPDVIVDPGEPPPLVFRGAGPPTVPVVTALFKVGRRLVVDALRPKPPPGPPPPPPPGPPPPPPPRSFSHAMRLP